MLPLVVHGDVNRSGSNGNEQSFWRAVARHREFGLLYGTAAANSQTAATPADAANHLVAAIGKGDIAGAAAFAATADRDRFMALMQASDRLAKARGRAPASMPRRPPLCRQRYPAAQRRRPSSILSTSRTSASIITTTGGRS
jgi:hypothetical protein